MLNGMGHESPVRCWIDQEDRPGVDTTADRYVYWLNLMPAWQPTDNVLSWTDTGWKLADATFDCVGSTHTFSYSSGIESALLPVHRIWTAGGVLLRHNSRNRNICRRGFRMGGLLAIDQMLIGAPAILALAA